VASQRVVESASRSARALPRPIARALAVVCAIISARAIMALVPSPPRAPSPSPRHHCRARQTSATAFVRRRVRVCAVRRAPSSSCEPSLPREPTLPRAKFSPRAQYRPDSCSKEACMCRRARVRVTACVCFALCAAARGPSRASSPLRVHVRAHRRHARYHHHAIHRRRVRHFRRTSETSSSEAAFRML
jgi:hypothetical protein